MDNYILQITAQLLAISPTPSPILTPTPKTQSVKITSTPTGFLRVRSAPNRNSSEVGRVNPGETYPLLDSVTDWYFIKAELPATSSGWISSEYAQKI